MADKKKYWRGIAELENPALSEKLGKDEFPEELPTDKFLGDKESLENSQTSRRDFLKYMGFSTAAATLAACESPVYESMPYVVAPEEVIPGIANYYATSYFDGHDYASVLMKTREGRPIKVENNKLAKLNGGANTRIHASVLNLYDGTRLQEPLVNGSASSWAEFDKEVKNGLEAADASGNKIVLLTGTVMSPSTEKLIKSFGEKYKNFQHLSVDAYSYSKKLDAYQQATGRRALPTYHFDQASVIASFGADFLGDWTGQRVSGDYAQTRIPGENMSRHVQFESNLSLTGSNADQRYKVKTTEMGTHLVALYNAIAGAQGQPTLPGGKSAYNKQIERLAQELIKAGEKALVVNGLNDTECELITIGINRLLSNAETTLSYRRRAHFRKGNDAQLSELLEEMQQSNVGALITHNYNLLYQHPQAELFKSAMSNVPTTVAIAQKNHETASASKYVAAENNFLESWGDYQPADGEYSLQQPTIRPLFDTRQFEECLMRWSDQDGSYKGFIQRHWSDKILGGKAWGEALHDGYFSRRPSGNDGEEDEQSFSLDGLSKAAQSLASRASNAPAMELNLYQKVGMGTGELANNPWLQELPDPISRISWDNYLTISAADALEMGFDNWNESNGALNGNYARLTVGKSSLENVPVLVQPGQAKGTVGLAVGYGRKGAGKVADKVGVNAFKLMGEGHFAPVSIEKQADSEHHFASVQLAHTMMGRDIVKETDINTFLSNPDG